MTDNSGFAGVTFMPVKELGISQIYISEDKLKRVGEWFSPEALQQVPLPVHDFGNGRYTLTDGHTRAFYAWRTGIQYVPVVYDMDDIITCAEGQMLYGMDIEWAQWYSLHSVADLAKRVVSGEDYKRLWIDRCDAGYELMTRTTPEQRERLSKLCPSMQLFGASSDLHTFYFENREGRVFEVQSGGI